MNMDECLLCVLARHIYISIFYCIAASPSSPPIGPCLLVLKKVASDTKPPPPPPALWCVCEDQFFISNKMLPFIPTTPSQINNPPPLDTSESPCLQMLCLHYIHPQGLQLPPIPFHNHTKALRRATPPAYNQPTCILYTHTHIHTGRRVHVMDGLPLSVMHESIICHPPAQRKEMLF